MGPYCFTQISGKMLYRIHWDDAACSNWISKDWSYDDAMNLCTELNRAYQLGVDSVKTERKPMGIRLEIAGQEAEETVLRLALVKDFGCALLRVTTPTKTYAVFQFYVSSLDGKLHGFQLSGINDPDIATDSTGRIAE